MQISQIPNLNNNSVLFRAKIQQEKPLLQKNEINQAEKLSYKNFSPAYFHPSFRGVQNEAIERFSNLTQKLVDKEISPEIYKNIITPIYAQIKNSISKNLGSGCRGSVFEINDKFALKFKYEPKTTESGVIALPDTKFSELKNWYGERIAIFMNDDSSILKNANPDGTFFPLGKNTSPIFKDKKTSAAIELCSKLPQKAFDDVTTMMNQLNKMQTPNEKFTFDYRNPSNFLISDKEIRVVDEININEEHVSNNINSLLSSLLLREDPHSLYQFDLKLARPRKEIMKKAIAAALNSNLKLDVQSAFETNYSLHLCNIDKKYSSFISDIEKIAAKSQTPEQRTAEIYKYFDKLE